MLIKPCIMVLNMPKLVNDSNNSTSVLDARKAAIAAAMQQIQKQYGTGSIMKLGERAEKLQIDTISTGSIAVDLALGVGGLPKGRIIEIFGPEASGKTTLCLHVIAEAQKKGGVAAFIDAEHALDPQRAQKIGINLDELLISQPDTGEQALEIADALIRSGGIDVLVVDSVAALVPKSELEGEMGESSIGVQARLMSQALRKLTGAVAHTNTIVIFTNQLRQKIGVMFGNPETTPGGLALKFYASIRLDVRKIENIKSGDQVVGSRHRAKVVKNKVAPPFRIAEFDMDENGVSHEGELLDVGIELGILTKSGAFIRWGEKLLGQGRPASVVYLKENKKEAQSLEKEIRDIWNKRKAGNDMVVGKEEEEDTAVIEDAANHSS
ncbi:MAG: Protein RecA [Candidatus Daviesbacteria bacterium GW2011_GWA2_38_24]|uniref:Protein RecA n=1 Tax=Candidatus Daviesbacteria bacterium GW2011_GWA2_38_24 TaxID=1618422 RepID=A0A0G0JKJ9_9BACT|nr:MAG: Protein RecA [Candidatus Daviesbacteria bacterium GW2011_GWA2_38_24]KKQ80196.1 MAG: Protein RecA [Candidatus Daviesbacteria bacterium GW2011_GWA1_38_7]